MENMHLREFAKAVFKRYFFTLFLAVAILIVTIPYNLLVPPDEYCNITGWVGQYAFLTAPFNIGCEAPLTSITTQGRALKFVGDFFLPILFTGLVETMLRKRRMENSIWVVFLAAMLASWLSSLITLTKNIGTSVIGLSMLLSITYLLERKSITTKQGPLGAVASEVAVVSGVMLGIMLYSNDGFSAHVAGFFSFVALMIAFNKKPEWLKPFYPLKRLWEHAQNVR